MAAARATGRGTRPLSSTAGAKKKTATRERVGDLVPYVDVFKHVRLDQWWRGDRKGDVSILVDKTIARRVYRIAGSVPAANYILIPKSKSQSLHMSGRYLYLQFKTSPARYFTMHFDVVAKDGIVIRISIGNLFKSFKATQSSLQFPYTDTTSKWTVLALDLAALISKYTTREYDLVRGTQLCSAMTVRTMFVSNNRYAPENLPRDMALLVPKGREWHDRYEWVWFPADADCIDDAVDLPVTTGPAERVPFSQLQPAVANKQRKTARVRFSGVDTNNNDGDNDEPTTPEKRELAPVAPLRTPLLGHPTPSKVGAATPTANTVGGGGGGGNQSNASGASFTSAKARAQQQEKNKQRVQDSAAAAAAEAAAAPGSDVLARPKGGAGGAGGSGSASNPSQWRGVDPLPAKARIDAGVVSTIIPTLPKDVRNKGGLLNPDPILSLRHVIGYSGDEACGSNLLWSPDASEVLFPSASVVIVMSVATHGQRFLIGHTGPIVSMAFSLDGKTLATAQGGEEPVIRLWDFESGESLAILKGHDHSLSAVTLSNDASLCAGVGRDTKGRVVIVIWNTRNVCERENGYCPVVTRFVTDSDITKIKFSPFGDNRLVSVGRGNIRFWRLKRGELRSCPVVLRGTSPQFFTDFDFELGIAERDTNGKRVFASTASGAVFQVDYSSLALEAVYQPHTAAINSICVVEGFCVTAGSDCFLRVWPLDFSSCFLEADHEAAVVSVDISYDCLKILAGTAKGTVGTIDIPTYAFDSLIRSHNSTVFGLAVDPNRPEFATVSCDGSVRVWSLHSMEQVYEFDSPSEVSRCVAYHPTDHVIACGFDSGVVRVFDVPSVSLICDFLQHEGPILDVKFTPDGRIMLTAGQDGFITAYDVVRDYHPFRTLEACPGPRISLSLSPGGEKLAFVGPGPSEVSIGSMASFAASSSFKIVGDGLVNRISFAANGKEVLVATSDSRLQRYEARSGRLLAEVEEAHRSEFDALTLSHNGAYVFTGGLDRVVKVWSSSLGGGPDFQAFVGHSDYISEIAVTADGAWVVSVGAGDAIHVWEFLGSGLAGGGSPQPPPSPSPELDASSEDSLVEAEGGGDNNTSSNALGDIVPATNRPTYTNSQGGNITAAALGLPVRHYVAGPLDSLPPAHRYAPEAGEAGISLRRLVGYSGNVCGALRWESQSGQLVYACGSSVVVEGVEGRDQSVLHGHTRDVSAVAVANGGRLIAAGPGGCDADGAAPILVWDANIGWDGCALILSYHERGVQALEFSPDGRFLVSVGCHEECSLVVWDVERASMLAATSTDNPVHTVVWAGDGSGEFAALGSQSVLFFVVQPADDIAGTEPRLIFQRGRIPGAVEKAAFTCGSYTENSKLLYTGTSTGAVVVWDTDTNKSVGVWPADNVELDVLAVHGARLVTGGVSGRLRTWAISPDPQTATDVALLEEMEMDGTAIVAASWDGSLSHGVVGTRSGTVWYVDWTADAVVRLVSGHVGPINGVDIASGRAVSTDIVSSAGEDGSLRVWVGTTGQQLMQFQVTNLAATAVAAMPSAVEVAAGYADGSVRFFDLNLVRLDRRFRPTTAAITALAVADRGRVLLIGTEEGKFLVLTAATGSLVLEYPDHEGSAITSIAVSPLDSSLFVVASDDRRASVWRASWSEKQCHVFDWLTFAAPGQGPPEFVDWPGGETLPPSLVCWSPVAATTLLYTGYARERNIVFYDVESHSVVRSLPLNQWALSLDVSRDGAYIALGTHDRLVKLVDYETGSFQDFAGHSGSVADVRFSADASSLVSVSPSQLCLWSVVL